MGQTFRFVLFLSSVLYCPLVSIPSNSSITEYKTSLRLLSPVQSTWSGTWGQGTGLTSQVHLLQHLRHVLPHHSCSTHVMLVLSWTLPSRKLAHYVKTGMWSSMWRVKEFKQGWTCQKYRYFETSKNVEKYENYFSCHKLLNGHVITENRILSSNFIQVWKINKFLPIFDFHKQTGKRVYKA